MRLQLSLSAKLFQQSRGIRPSVAGLCHDCQGLPLGGRSLLQVGRSGRLTALEASLSLGKSSLAAHASLRDRSHLSCNLSRILPSSS